MKCLIIVGPPASGKMTVGRAIAKKTGYALLHNHMSIELILQFFKHSSKPFLRLDNLIRFSIMKEVAKSDLPGFIFTYVWAFGTKGELSYIRKIERIFNAQGIKPVFLELECPLEERKKRNRTALRLEHKPSKRYTNQTEKVMIQHDLDYRFNSKPGEFKGRKHFKLNNKNLSPEKVADAAIKFFKL